MQLIKLSLLAVLTSYAATQDIDDNDVPSQCRSVCSSVVALTTDCDRANNDNDAGYINCVCSGTNAASVIPACEACVANFDRNDGHDNDVNDLIRSCSFTTTAFVSGATLISGTVTPTSSGQHTAQTVTDTAVTGSISSAASSRASSISTALAGQSSSLSSALSSLSSSVSNQLAGATPTPTDNAAVKGGQARMGMVVGLLAGVAGLV